MKPFELNETGLCSSCSKKITEEKLQCTQCETFFHGTCSVGDPLCTNKAFLRWFNTTSTNKLNFTWRCDECITLSETDKVATLSQQLSALREAVQGLTNKTKSVDDLKEGLETKMDKEFNMLTESLNSSITSQMVEIRKELALPKKVEADPAYEGTVWDNRERINNVVKSSIMLKPDTQGNPVDQKKLKAVVIDNGIKVDKVVVSSTGDTFINFPSDNQREKLAPLLQTNNINNNVVTLKSKLPTISLLHVTENMTHEKIVEGLCNQNESIGALVSSGQELSVVFTKPPTEQYTNYQVVLRVSPDIRKAIKSYNNKLHLGVKVCKVVDRFYVRRCNRCQGFGHYSSSCKGAVPVVCGYCMENHDSNDCHLKGAAHTEHKCNNCRVAGLDVSGHSTFWYQCPAYIIQQNKLKSSISYNYNSN